MERVEIMSTRLTGATFTEAHLKNVLFKECKLDLAFLRITHLQQCVFEKCNLIDADFYERFLRHHLPRLRPQPSRCSQVKLAGADIRSCRLDGLRGTPITMDRLAVHAQIRPRF